MRIPLKYMISFVFLISLIIFVFSLLNAESILDLQDNSNKDILLKHNSPNKDKIYSKIIDEGVYGA